VLKILVADREIKYTGKELTPHWIYRNFDLRGDAAVAFVGPAQVDVDDMVDLTNVKEQGYILHHQC